MSVDPSSLSSDDASVLFVQIDDVSGSTECIEFGHSAEDEAADAVAPDNVLGIPLFLEDLPEEELSRVGLERVDSIGRPSFRIDVKTLLNLEDSTTGEEESSDLQSPNSTSISHAMSAVGFPRVKDQDTVPEEDKKEQVKSTADLSSIGSLKVHEGAHTPVLDVRRTAHARFNPATNSFEGLPAEWTGMFTKKFGLPLQLCATTEVEGYTARLPPILLEMKEYLLQNGGLDTKGIFRLAPEKEEAALVKQQFNDGTFKGCGDVNIIANLLKVWFRDMPAKLLDQSVDGPTSILQCTSVEEAGTVIMEKFRDPHRSLLLWLLDQCVLISDNSDVNMMTPQNMAIVFSPNLCKVADASSSKVVDPVKFISECTKYTSFLENAIIWRKETSPNSKHK